MQDVNEGMGLQGQASNAVELSDDMISSSSTDPDVDSSAAVSVTVDMTEDTSTEQPLSPDISDDPVTVMIVEDDEGKSMSSDPGLLSKTREVRQFKVFYHILQYICHHFFKVNQASSLSGGPGREECLSGETCY